MPLKHFTETFLVVVLGAAIALTGLLVATLPPLPDGALPWAVLFILSVIYPLSLYSLFQKRRADNFFRNLHWFPAAMLLLWLALQLTVFASTITLSQVSFYSWGWSLGVVVFGFVLLVAFILKVIRRRVPRLWWLALILVPFTALAFMNEQQGKQWEGELASALWGADFWHMHSNGLLAGILDVTSTAGSGMNLDPSEDPSEEEWRERLRMQKNREERIAARLDDHSSKSAGSASNSSEHMMEESSASSQEPMVSGTGEELRNAGTMPHKLPDSGFGWSSIVVLLGAAYCTTLQKKASERA